MKKKKESRRNIPPEIVNFFNAPGGHSLLVKGEAGTGKTTFALELIEEVSSPDESAYISTRVSDESLYIQFPWLRSEEKRQLIIDSSKDFLKTIYPYESVYEREAMKEEERLRGAKDFLRYLHPEQIPPPRDVDRRHLSRFLIKHPDVPPIKRIYDIVNSKLPKKPLIVIDSIDALTKRYDVPQTDLINTLQKDLVENSNTNLLIVLETIELTPLDYFVDGLVTLKESLHEGRCVRTIYLNKLRGTARYKPSYTFTLDGGHFQYFEPFESKLNFIKGMHKPIKDKKGSKLAKEGKFSSGCESLDSLLANGYRRGDFILIELKENVSADALSYIVGPTIENFLSQEHGVVSVSSDVTSTAMMEKTTFKRVKREKVNKNLRVIGKKVRGRKRPYMVERYVDNFEGYVDVWMMVCRELEEQTNNPVLVIESWDIIDAEFPRDEIEKGVTKFVSQSKASGYLNIGIIKPGLSIAQKLRNIADMHFKIDSINGTLVFYGENPRTEMYNLDLDVGKYTCTKLTPIV